MFGIKLRIKLRIKLVCCHFFFRFALDLMDDDKQWLACSPSNASIGKPIDAFERE